MSESGNTETPPPGENACGQHDSASSSSATERMEQARLVFVQALEHPADERASFIAQACGEDTVLLTEVESLLAHHQRAGDDFMRPPDSDGGAARLLDDQAPDPLIGQRIGRYHIKSVIAAGGMGTVYEAVQEEPRRVVALKVMKRNIASRSALRRFQFESQVLARLRHPNIAQVHEAGTHTPPSSMHKGQDAGPFFAMEYITGTSVGEELREKETFPVAEACRIIAGAAEGLKALHETGVVHRDITPSNILIDREGKVRIVEPVVPPVARVLINKI